MGFEGLLELDLLGVSFGVVELGLQTVQLLGVLGRFVGLTSFSLSTVKAEVG